MQPTISLKKETPWKEQRTFVILVFSGGIKWRYWIDMGYNIPSRSVLVTEEVSPNIFHFTLYNLQKLYLSTIES